MNARLPAWARPKDIADLLRLSVPIAISRMAMMLMSLTDAIVLGQFAPGELPYILNSYLPVGIALGLGMGLLLGVQVLTSELLGAGREAESGRIFRRGLAASVVIGTVLTVVVWLTAPALFEWLFVTVAPPTGAGSADPAETATRTAAVTRILALCLLGFMMSTACSYYLEALRRPLLVTVVMYLGVVLNLVIGLALVGGWWGMPQLGAEGVAWATTGARWALALALLGLVCVYTPALQRSPPAAPGEVTRQFSVGTGTAISNVAEWGGFNLTYVIATWISLGANTVYGYATQVMGLCFMFYLGIASATSVRVAEGVGRREAQEVRDAGRLGVAATVIMGALLGLVLIGLGGPISRLLVRPDAVMDGLVLAPVIAGLLVLTAFATVFDGVQATASFALRAQGMVWLPSAIHLGSFFLVMLPVCYWLGIAEGRGARGVMEGACVGVLVAGLAQVALLEWRASRPLMPAPGEP